MSINTTVKVGFDGTAVKSGLKNIGGMFGKFSKEVGIGATRKVGELGTDLLGKTLSFFAETPAMFMDYAGDLKDLSTLTDVSVNKLQILQEAFRLAGVDSIDAGKSIGLLAKAIYEAQQQVASGEGGNSLKLCKNCLAKAALECCKRIAITLLPPCKKLKAILQVLAN